MKKSTSLLLLFVKHPEPGKSKTRLAADIGHDLALEIYQKLLAHTCRISSDVEADKVVFYGNQMPSHDLWSEAGFLRLQQEGHDLGSRMENAFRWGFSQGYERIVIIGSDCATLTSKILSEAFDVLKSEDYVLGPARDGGYYLLGMKELFSPVFYHKNWSTDTVLTDTLNDLQSANRSFDLLPELSDIDHAEDLRGTFLEEYLT